MYLYAARVHVGGVVLLNVAILPEMFSLSVVLLFRGVNNNPIRSVARVPTSPTSIFLGELTRIVQHIVNIRTFGIINNSPLDKPCLADKFVYRVIHYDSLTHSLAPSEPRGRPCNIYPVLAVSCA